MKKQFLLASALTLGISGLGTIGYAQASMTDAHGGSENVDNSHGLKASKTYDNNVSTRSIKQGKKSGGYWVRGTTSKTVKSNYKHYSHKGHASVINGSGNGNSGGWKKPGHWSKSFVKKTWSGNKAFYDHT